MAYASDNANSAELEREIEEDRRRIGERIDAIQQRLSPGQLLDEALSYAKSNGGAEFASNLTTQVKSNPLPTALLGVSLAWLMASSKTPPSTRSTYDDDDYVDDYPLATVQGDIRRSGPIQTDGGQRYSHFTDSAGSRFKALTDETGRRAGHFMDESGRTFRGFADASGRQIHDIRDEAGKLFDEASGWVAKTWRKMGDATSRAGSAAMGAGNRAGSAAMGVGRSSLDMGSDLLGHMGDLNQNILKGLKEQPLIAGALAFAAGAALGAALPRTKEEDQLMGEMADKARNRISAEASRKLDQAEKIATDAYQRTAAVAGDVYDEARDHIVQEAKAFSKPDGRSEPQSRPH